MTRASQGDCPTRRARSHMRRRPVLLTASLMALAWTGVPVLAQSTNQTPATTAPAQAPDQQPPADTTPAQTPDHTAPSDTTPSQTPDKTAPTDQQPSGGTAPAQTSGQGTPADPNQAQPAGQGRPPAQTPGVRTGTVKLGDTVTVGGYGSARYELNNLEKPKPSGFDFRRFVLATDATPNDRLQAYIELEFERLAEIEVERAVDRSDEGVAFAEELEGGNGGELSIEQMWGQFKFGEPFCVRFGQI